MAARMKYYVMSRCKEEVALLSRASKSTTRVRVGAPRHIIHQSCYKLSNSTDSSNKNRKREQNVARLYLNTLRLSNNPIDGNCKIFDVVRVQPRLNGDVRNCATNKLVEKRRIYHRNSPVLGEVDMILRPQLQDLLLGQSSATKRCQHPTLLIGGPTHATHNENIPICFKIWDQSPGVFNSTNLACRAVRMDLILPLISPRFSHHSANNFLSLRTKSAILAPYAGGLLISLLCKIAN